MAEVPHPCVADTSCATNFFAETDPLSPNYGKLIPRDQIDPDPNNGLSCGPSGLYATRFPQGEIITPISVTTAALNHNYTQPPITKAAPLVLGTITVPSTPVVDSATTWGRWHVNVAPTWSAEFERPTLPGVGPFIDLEVTWTIGAVVAFADTIARRWAPTSWQLAGTQHLGPCDIGNWLSRPVALAPSGDNVAITARLVYWGPTPGYLNRLDPTTMRVDFLRCS